MGYKMMVEKAVSTTSPFKARYVGGKKASAASSEFVDLEKQTSSSCLSTRFAFSPIG
jgi:hypothetical protein